MAQILAPGSADDDAAIILEGVHCRFGDVVALADLDLRIPAGQTTVVVGPSGCGKSTVLRSVIGLVWPQRGTVRCLGERVDATPLIALRRRLGYVIQEGGLFPHLSAGANATLMARELGWDREKIDGRLAELCQLTRLDAGLLARLPSELSGGQRQRVALMRALFLSPAVVLMDEPLGALDPMVRADLQDDLTALFAALDTTVVMVTHDLAEAAFLGDRIVVMAAGRVLQVGPYQELVEQPADELVTRFVTAQRRVHL